MPSSPESPALDKDTVLSLLSSPKQEEPRETVTFWYGGWSLNELRKMKPDLFYEQSWYDKEKFADEKHEPGMYTVCLKVPESNGKTFAEQKQLLDKDDVCPVAIAATALLLTLIQKGKDPLENDWCRCAEPLPDDRRAALAVDRGRVYVNLDWDDYRDDYIWLSASRKS